MNNGILSEKAPLEKTVAQFQEQINKGQVINPVSGCSVIEICDGGRNGHDRQTTL